MGQTHSAWMPIALRGVDRCRSCRHGTGSYGGGADGNCTSGGGGSSRRRAMISQIHITAIMLGTTFAHGGEEVERRMLEQEGVRDDPKEAGIELIPNFWVPVALCWVNGRRGSGCSRNSTSSRCCGRRSSNHRWGIGGSTTTFPNLEERITIRLV